MNLIEKLIWYIKLKRINYRNAFITAFGNNKLTTGDVYFLVLLACLILSVLTVFFADAIDNTIAEHKKRAIDARYAQLETLNKLHDREKVLVTMLNSGYVRIDGRKVKIQQCDASGECK